MMPTTAQSLLNGQAKQTSTTLPWEECQPWGAGVSWVSRSEYLPVQGGWGDAGATPGAFIRGTLLTGPVGATPGSGQVQKVAGATLPGATDPIGLAEFGPWVRSGSAAGTIPSTAQIYPVIQNGAMPTPPPPPPSYQVASPAAQVCGVARGKSITPGGFHFNPRWSSTNRVG